MIRSLVASVRSRIAQRNVSPAHEPVVIPFPHRPAVLPERSMALRQARFVVFDTETTGLRPSHGDEIVQIGAVRVADGAIVESDVFDTLVNPKRAIPARSTQIHGITSAMVANAPPAADALRRFHAFAGDDVLVAYNAAFDMSFLAHKERETRVAFSGPVLDPMLLAIHLEPRAAGHSLSAVAAKYGISAEGRHSALGDALMTARLLVAMFASLERRGLDRLDRVLALSQRLMRQRQHEHQF